MIEGTITVGLSVPKQPELPEVIRYLEGHKQVLAGGIAELYKDIARQKDKLIIEQDEEELKVALHEYDCLSVAIHTLKELA